MKLIIFPGGGSPGNPKYGSVYRLLELEAKNYGYTSTDISLRWPGHEKNGVLTLEGAQQLAEAKLDELEAGSEKYDILARSFGCYVALKIALDKKPKGLRKIILWGPPPYWLMWEMWCKQLETWMPKAAEKGLSVDEKLFPSVVPIECMLPQISYETVVATGTQDPYVSHNYLRYLESLVQERKSDKFCQSIKIKEAVPGAVHEVTEDSPKPVIAAYMKALFE